jgi:hypothetical protein
MITVEGYHKNIGDRFRRRVAISHWRGPGFDPTKSRRSGAAISGSFCAEKVQKKYTFGTHLAVNI